jgi:hypothetical protein
MEFDSMASACDGVCCIKLAGIVELMGVDEAMGLRDRVVAMGDERSITLAVNTKKDTISVATFNMLVASFPHN